jgi:hypothetical protein
MALFKVNAGTREQEVCKLRWEWEMKVPALNTSVFVVPGALVKNDEDRLIVLNPFARAVVDRQRGKHPDYVFSYRCRRRRRGVGSDHRLRVHEQYRVAERTTARREAIPEGVRSPGAGRLRTRPRA